ncbi:MAG TPA: GlsB/YeaQ/YmgE family stress response membrane protein [Rhizomicrobium sp.]|jgi:uncharacterized membrane protein YeaQ/YmgE (transglycosylase-associated protein family)|nr:GlsB/YeaQ/YmgE family stress response membrane protein [Rhizomicrobium sp.]
MLSIFGWIVVGALSGFIASRIVNKRGEGCIINMALGLVGAVVGGFIFQALGGPASGGFLYSTLVAIVGAIIVLFLWHAITGNRTLR